MRTLLRKELRELAWLAVPLAIAWAAWWNWVRPAEGLVTVWGSSFGSVVPFVVAIGVAFGFLPFEIERLRGMAAYLVHRGLSARQVATAKVVASTAWTAAIVAIALVLAGVHTLLPALVVPGYSANALRVLCLTLALAFPSVAVGAMVGNLPAAPWLRWLALFVLGDGLTSIAGHLSASGLVDSPLGVLPYSLFCVSLTLLSLWLAVGRFASSLHEDATPPASIRWASGALVLLFVMPVVQTGVMTLQYRARAYAWHRNDYWVRGEDEDLHPRPLGDRLEDRGERESRGLSTGHGDWAYWSDAEGLAFHPISGTRRWSSSMLGDQSDFGERRPWALNRLAGAHKYQVSIDDWSVRLDTRLNGVVSSWHDESGRLRLAMLPLEADREGTRPMMANSFPGVVPTVLLTTEDHRVWGVLERTPDDVEFRPATMPGNDRIVSNVFANDLQVGGRDRTWTPQSGHVLVGESGTYFYDEGEFLEVSAYEPQRMSEDRKARVTARVERYDGLSYEVTLLDEDDGRALASARVAPRTLSERTAALVAMTATLARAPLASVATHALSGRDEDGSSTPAASLWSDPLVFGGRRLWLVALNQLVALALAWLARRRLGGRAWGWPLAIVALGVAAWLVCRVLEPRRVRPLAAEVPRGVPAWAPIADRAGA